MTPTAEVVRMLHTMIQLNTSAFTGSMVLYIIPKLLEEQEAKECISKVGKEATGEGGYS